MNKKTITRIVLSGCVMAALMSCGSKSATNSASEDAAVADNSEITTPANPDQIQNRVKAIYEAVAVAYPDARDIAPSNDSLDLAFCSDEWQTLVTMVNAKDAEEMGVDHFFESDYWIMGQDWGAISISDIKVDIKDNTHADVDLILHHLSDINVKLEMVFDRGEWLINNFIDQTNEVDWKKNMKEYLEKKAKPRGNGGADGEITDYPY